MIAKASRAWARRVEDGGQLKAVLAEAIAHVMARRGAALVEVMVRP
jgi:acetolactate synthase-1/2/3 large subunit